MATASDNVMDKNDATVNWRIEAIIKIQNESKKKNWCEAEKLYDDYKDYCKPYWQRYDTLFNGKFNKCGFCMKMKRALVRSKWSCSENYPLYRQLVCVNENCEFFFIINSDIDNSEL